VQKKIDVKGATVEKGKEEKTKYWINITTSNKKVREIAAISADDAKAVIAALQAASGGAASPTKGKDEKKGPSQKR